MPDTNNSDVCEVTIAKVAAEIATGHSPTLDALFEAARMAGPAIAIDPAPATLPDGRLRALAEQWGTWPRRDGIPTADALDPLEFVSALDIVMLLRVLDDGMDFEYLVYGSEVAGGFGRSMIGCRISETTLPTPVRALFLGGYRAALSLRRALYTRHDAPPGVAVAHWSRLILPLADGTGRITRLLVGNVPGPRRRGLS